MRMELPLKHDNRYTQHFAGVHSESYQTSEMEIFAETINSLKQLKTLIAKRSTLGVWQDSGHASSFVKSYI